MITDAYFVCSSFSAFFLLSFPCPSDHHIPHHIHILLPLLTHSTLLLVCTLRRRFLHDSTLLQIARAKEIKSHFLQKQARESTDARKMAEVASQGVIVSLGLMKPAGEEGGGGEGKK